MSLEHDEIQITKLELILMVGTIGCMLFATWELGHLMADDWLSEWVAKNSFTNRRIILYGIASIMSIASLLSTTMTATRLGRFRGTANRAFLWYGTLLLLSTIAIFVFDCLPEVFAGFIGAAVFLISIYILQKRYFTWERVARARLNKGQCPGCGAALQASSFFCPGCAAQVGRNCKACNGYARLTDRYCSGCGWSLA